MRIDVHVGLRRFICTRDLNSYNFFHVEAGFFQRGPVFLYYPVSVAWAGSGIIVLSPCSYPVVALFKRRRAHRGRIGHRNAKVDVIRLGAIRASRSGVCTFQFVRFCAGARHVNWSPTPILAFLTGSCERVGDFWLAFCVRTSLAARWVFIAINVLLWFSVFANGRLIISRLRWEANGHRESRISPTKNQKKTQ